MDLGTHATLPTTEQMANRHFSLSCFITLDTSALKKLSSFIIPLYPRYHISYCYPVCFFFLCLCVCFFLFYLGSFLFLLYGWREEHLPGNASHPLPRTLARLSTSAAAAAEKKKKDDLRRELPPVPLLPQPEGRRVLRQEENGRAEAEGPEVQGQREQACNE